MTNSKTSQREIGKNPDPKISFYESSLKTIMGADGDYSTSMEVMSKPRRSLNINKDEIPKGINFRYRSTSKQKHLQHGDRVTSKPALIEGFD